MSRTRRTVLHCHGNTDGTAKSVESRTSPLISALLSSIAGGGVVEPSMPNAKRPNVSTRTLAVWKPPVIRDLGRRE